MVREQPAITLKPIGVVRNEMKQPQREGWENVVSDIIIDNSLTEALDGLEEFSHVIVIYWLHKTADSGLPPVKLHPKGRTELPLVGVLATRSPRRPNPVAIATVRLLKRQGNRLQVEGLDASDGTPVIDIKPHLPHNDSPADARVAPWITRH